MDVPYSLPVVFVRERLLDLLRPVLPQRTVFVNNRRAFFGASFTRRAVAFVDAEYLDLVDGANVDVPIVAVLDVPAADTLEMTIQLLDQHPWLSHVIQAPLLSLGRARAHLEALIDRLASQSAPGLPSSNGRVALLARASRREARLARMRDYFIEHQVPERVITSLVDVGEELIMNGLYNAPMEAGFCGRVHTRDEDIELPPDRACEITYGVEDATLFVRLRDKFGALRRERMLEVLARCSGRAVDLDVSRGGAGLGLWRIFSAASNITVAVVPGQSTDITVVVGKQDSRRMARPLSVDLFFAEPQQAAWPSLADDREDRSLAMDQSITLMVQDGSTPTPTPTPN
jgi:hypothetical protein